MKKYLHILMVLILLAFMQAPVSSKSGCQLSQKEVAFLKIYFKDSRQRRRKPVCHPTLLQLARERARDMAVRRYFSHTNPDGIGPNYLLQKKGYKLPKYWGKGKSSNYIESISAGRSTAGAAYQGWMKSPGHRRHVLGTSKFYGGQSVV